MAKFRRIGGSILIIAMIIVGSFWTKEYSWDGRLDVRYLATPEEVVIEILKMARVTPADIVYCIMKCNLLSSK